VGLAWFQRSLVLPLGKGAYRSGVPVEFLSDREVAAYGRYTEAPSPAELDRWFFLDDAGKALVRHRRGDHHRLGSPYN
jgi:hypothetical protein